jgi:hypothetical protein
MAIAKTIASHRTEPENASYPPPPPSHFVLARGIGMHQMS